MKTIEKGILKIETNENQEAKVLFEPVNGVVWLSKSELPELFGVNLQTIHACVESIFKTKLFKEKEVSQYDLYVSGNRIKYDMREFRFEVIIAMAFRIDSPKAKILREWCIGQCFKPTLFDFPSDDQQNYSLN